MKTPTYKILAEQILCISSILASPITYATSTNTLQLNLSQEVAKALVFEQVNGGTGPITLQLPPIVTTSEWVAGANVRGGQLKVYYPSTDANAGYVMTATFTNHVSAVPHGAGPCIFDHCLVGINSDGVTGGGLANIIRYKLYYKPMTSGPVAFNPTASDTNPWKDLTPSIAPSSTTRITGQNGNATNSSTTTGYAEFYLERLTGSGEIPSWSASGLYTDTVNVTFSPQL